MEWFFFLTQCEYVFKVEENRNRRNSFRIAALNILTKDENGSDIILSLLYLTFQLTILKSEREGAAVFSTTIMFYL